MAAPDQDARAIRMAVLREARVAVGLAVAAETRRIRHAVNEAFDKLEGEE